MKRQTLVDALLFMGTFSLAQANPEASLAVRRGNNLFSSQLYDTIRKDTKENLVVSPVSVGTAFAMLQAGARGETANTLRSVFHFPPNEQLNSGYTSLIKQLQSDGNVTLEMANRIYPAEGFQLNPQFRATLKDYFSAEPQQLNYGNKTEAARKINAFVSQATHDKIRDLVGPNDLSERTKLVIVNAIYFKGAWEEPFPKGDTRKGTFYTSETTSVKVDMMNLQTDMRYAEVSELGATAVGLPYKGDNWWMIVLLPHNRTGLTKMEDKLKSFPLDKIVDSLSFREVDLYLPKFKLESTIHLEKPLTQLGAGDIFNPTTADFSGISPSENLSVSKAIQKAFIEVNEVGSEAAAATLVAAVPVSAILNPPPVPVVRVDHPFYSMIVHREIDGKNVQTTPVFVQRMVNI